MYKIDGKGTTLENIHLAAKAEFLEKGYKDASLDVENETLIQTALSRLIADKTVLVIAHRMRTVAGADKIVVLSDGTVAEEGSPKDLEEKNGVYTHMVKLQTESQNWKLA